MEDKSPRLKLTEKDGVAVIELVDRKILDEATISEISEQLYAVAARSPRPRVVLDFANVSHMSSSALGMLIRLHKRITEKGGALRLCNIRPSIYEVFVITRLNEVFSICADCAAGVAEAAKA